jgi:hypothetical protein
MIDKSYIVEITQQIVDKSFTSSIERKIFKHDNRVNLRCPYCLEGKTKGKKRGNVYFDKLIYVCFRCGKKTNFDKFTKDFGLRLDPEKKLEIIDHLNSQITFKDAEEDLMDSQLDKLIDFVDLEQVLNSGELPIQDFKPVQSGTEIYTYLLNRGIPSQFHQNIWTAKFYTSETRYEPIICFLNRRGSKIIGLQVRNLKDGKRRLFKIYNFETLYKWVKNIDEIEDIDANQLVIYNKLSYYFNILNIDFAEKITVFEGFLDSLFYPNSIGVVGVNSDMRFLENNDLDLQYFYDNDTAGFQKSEEKLKLGYPVFLWKKLFESIVESKKSQDPYGLMYRISKVKDLNKLAELTPSPYSKLSLEKYFSKDVMDMRFIPKKVKKPFSRVKF